MLSSFSEPTFVLIQGASRGIGLALTQQLLMCDKVTYLFATSRNPRKSPELQALQQKYPNRLVCLSMDITDEQSIQRASQQVREHTHKLHLLVNSSGLLHDNHDEMFPEKRLADVNPEHLHRSFAVNALGPLLMGKHFQSFFRHREHAVWANISARVGSITDNRLGGWYAYRATKAAQNMLTKTMSIEFARTARNTVCIALHPGTVDTQLSEPFQARVPTEKLFTTDKAASQLLQVIDGLTHKNNGQFFAWDGSSIPW